MGNWGSFTLEMDIRETLESAELDEIEELNDDGDEEPDDAERLRP